MIEEQRKQYPEWRHGNFGYRETVIDYPSKGLYLSMATANLPVDPVTKSGKFLVVVVPLETTG